MLGGKISNPPASWYSRVDGVKRMLKSAQKKEENLVRSGEKKVVTKQTKLTPSLFPFHLLMNIVDQVTQRFTNYTQWSSILNRLLTTLSGRVSWAHGPVTQLPLTIAVTWCMLAGTRSNDLCNSNDAIALEVGPLEHIPFHRVTMFGHTVNLVAREVFIPHVHIAEIASKGMGRILLQNRCSPRSILRLSQNQRTTRGDHVTLCKTRCLCSCPCAIQPRLPPAKGVLPFKAKVVPVAVGLSVHVPNNRKETTKANLVHYSIS